LIENNHASATSATDASVQVQSDGLVRPKLKLLPQTKPLDAMSQTPILEVTENSHSGLMSKSYDYHSAASSLPVEQLEASTENNRKSLCCLTCGRVHETNFMSQVKKLDEHSKGIQINHHIPRISRQENNRNKAPGSINFPVNIRFHLQHSKFQGNSPATSAIRRQLVVVPFDSQKIRHRIKTGAHFKADT